MKNRLYLFRQNPFHNQGKGQKKTVVAKSNIFFKKVIIQEPLTNIYSHGQRSLQRVNYSNGVTYITWIIRIIRRHCTIINSNESYLQFQTNTLTSPKNDLKPTKCFLLNFFLSTTSSVQIEIFEVLCVKSEKLFGNFDI